MKYIHHSDKAHGWLEVTVADCQAVKLNPSDFSACSYKDGDTLYLEEDCDMSKFMAACICYDKLPTIEHSHSNGESPIRKMEHLQV